PARRPSAFSTTRPTDTGTSGPRVTSSPSTTTWTRTSTRVSSSTSSSSTTDPPPPGTHTASKAAATRPSGQPRTENTMPRTITLALTLLALAASGANAQQITWSTIDGGGTMQSTGGRYALSGTIGQPDASS